MKDADYIIVMITCSSKREAGRIKKVLLEQRCVACVNIIPEVKSFFWWTPTLPPPEVPPEGRRVAGRVASRLRRAPAKIDSASEVLLLAKTKSKMFEEIVALVRKIHKYEVPEIIALPIIGGNEEYLKWISESLGCKARKG